MLTSLDENEPEQTELTFTNSEGVEYRINISSLPEFEAYLNENSNREVEIERSSYEFLELQDDNQFILFKYSCGVKLCQTLLVKINNDNKTISSVPLLNGIFINEMTKQSPNLKSTLFFYGVNEGNHVFRNKVIVVDIKSMAIIPFKEKENSIDFSEEAIYPITEYSWISNEVLQLKIADLESTEYDSVLKWHDSERKTRDVKIILQNTSS